MSRNEIIITMNLEDFEKIEKLLRENGKLSHNMTAISMGHREERYRFTYEEPHPAMSSYHRAKVAEQQ